MPVGKPFSTGIIFRKKATTMKKASDYSKEELELYLDKYSYYKPGLTDTLDDFGDGAFDELIILKIILWKVHRYAELGKDLLSELNSVRVLEKEQREDAKTVLEALLNTPGIDLPMASTLLRFRNPNVFQIIDQRAYRSVMDTDKYPLYTASSVEKKVKVYFDYLKAIDGLCEQKGIAFFDADRILYQFDKKENGKLKPREGWEEQFQQMHENGDDKLIIPDVLPDEV